MIHQYPIGCIDQFKGTKLMFIKCNTYSKRHYRQLNQTNIISITKVKKIIIFYIGTFLVNFFS